MYIYTRITITSFFYSHIFSEESIDSVSASYCHVRKSLQNTLSYKLARQFLLSYICLWVGSSANLYSFAFMFGIRLTDICL